MSPRSANDALIDPALVARFRADLARLLSEGLGPGEALALAVSGGPDSMAMLLLAAAALPGQVAAATVDHGLRPGAAAEAALVGDACGELGVPHAVLRPASPIAAGNLQAEARVARYALLRAWATQQGARVLATAHHADDQAETFLMRASRAAGLSGLAAVRPRRREGALTLVRPLLGWPRAVLAEVVAGAGVRVAHDPSNGDPRYDRTRLRALLARQDVLDPAGIARAAGHIAEAEAEWQAVADWFWAERARPGAEGELLVDAAGLPRAVQRLLLRRALAACNPAFDQGANVESTLRTLIAGVSANQAGVLASAKGGLWRFRDEPPRRDV